MASSSAHEETFVSDIHLECKNTPSSEGNVVSRFTFSIPSLHDSLHGCSVCHPGKKVCSLDNDGDLIVPRNSDIKLLLIEHALCTTLYYVGHQVWRGALLLADFLIYCKHIFKDSTILELGGGVGLVSIVASLFCQVVFCTDTGKSVLDNCQRNIDYNVKNLEVQGDVQVRQLDWHTPFKHHLDDPDQYQWQVSDHKQLQCVEYILAADVVYDDELTNSFLRSLIFLNYSKLKNPAIIYIAVEKRINFTLDELAPAVPVYRYFLECLSKPHYTESGDIVYFRREMVDISDISQSFNYDRVKYMELWKIETFKKSTK